MRIMMKTCCPAALLLACTFTVAETESDLDPDEVSAAREAVRAATAKYSDVEAALAAGYMPDPHGECVAIPGVGGMGIHYLRPICWVCCRPVIE